MKRLFLLIVVLVAALSLVPSASALDGPGVEISDAEWYVPCNSGFALVAYHITWYMNIDGVVIRETQSGSSALYGSYSESHETVVEGPGWNGTSYWPLTVPPDGYAQYTVEIWSPTDVLLTSASVYASCPDGELRVNGSALYGNVPLPSERVMGHVQYDTPLYTEADPATVREEVLTAGQTWFVLGSETGTDGKEWYEVFVGGWNTVYVPAAAMTLDGPIP